MRIVATETGNAPSVHEAGDEIIPLHPVLVCRPVREVSESCFPELVFLQLLEVRQLQANMEADRPVIVFSFDRIFQWPAL